MEDRKENVEITGKTGNYLDYRYLELYTVILKYSLAAQFCLKTKFSLISQIHSTYYS